MYLVEQRQWREHQERLLQERRRINQTWQKLKDDLGDTSEVFSWSRCILESVIIIISLRDVDYYSYFNEMISLSVIPLYYLATELLFYFGTLHINQDLLDILYH